MIRLLSIALVCSIVGFVSTSFAKDETKTEMKNAEKIVGNWKLVKCEVMKDTVKTGHAEFLKDKTCKMHMTMKDDKEVTKNGTYEFTGEDKLKITSTDKDTKEDEKTKELTIEKLTDTTLIVVHPKGEKTEFERVKEEMKK